jgi:GNAT superfamily N-acetyltransferase
LHIRQAIPTDAVSLVTIKESVWPSDNPSATHDHIARILSGRIHQWRESLGVSLLAEDEQGVPLGFVDAFMTKRADEALRWEVDLLAVRPEAQGQGLGQALLRDILAWGRHQGAHLARALIHLDNLASAGAFARCGFSTDYQVHHLHVCDTTHEPVDKPAALHTVPVHTLSYSGIWLEGEWSIPALQFGRSLINGDFSVAGTLIPATTLSGQANALGLGYHLIGDYHFWTLNF